MVLLQNFVTQNNIADFFEENLNGEAGEVADKIKKHLRDGKLDIGSVIYELGDVCWYIARLAEAFGYQFEDVLEINRSKLESRKTRNVLTGSGDAR